MMNGLMNKLTAIALGSLGAGLIGFSLFYNDYRMNVLNDIVTDLNNGAAWSQYESFVDLLMRGGLIMPLDKVDAILLSILGLILCYISVNVARFGLSMEFFYRYFDRKFWLSFELPWQKEPLQSQAVAEASQAFVRQQQKEKLDRIKAKAAQRAKIAKFKK